MPRESSPVDNLLRHLKGVKPGGQGKWTALCPGHEDRRNSLSIGLGDDGRVLLKCFAGCMADEIVTVIGLKMADLFVGGGGES